MFFLKTANIMAWILVVVGGIRTMTALAFATIVLDHEKMIAFSKRYLGASNTGEAIDFGPANFCCRNCTWPVGHNCQKFL